MLKVSVRKWYRREKDKVSSGAKKRNEMQVYTFYYCLLCIVYPGGVRQLTNELQPLKMNRLAQITRKQIMACAKRTGTMVKKHIFPP